MIINDNVEKYIDESMNMPYEPSVEVRSLIPWKILGHW